MILFLPITVHFKKNMALFYIYYMQNGLICDEERLFFYALYKRDNDSYIKNNSSVVHKPQHILVAN